MDKNSGKSRMGEEPNQKSQQNELPSDSPFPEAEVRKESMPVSLILICGSILLLTASQIIRANVPAEYRLFPLILVPICLLLFFLGVRSVERIAQPAWFTRLLQPAAAWFRTTPGQLVSLLFSLFFSILTITAAGFSGKMFSPAAAALCWGAGILLAVYGALQLSFRKQAVSKRVLITGLVLFAAAFALRAFDTATIPIVLSGDEGSSGLFSLNFLNGTFNNLFVVGWFSFPSLFNFLQSISIAIFGQTAQALRLPSAFAGALTVALVFSIGYTMYGYFPGLMAAIFLTGLHFANHFSRIGLNNIWDGVFFVLVLGFVWVGWQRENRAAFLVAGVGLGLAQYFYSTGRLLFAVIPFWLLVAGLSDKPRFRRSLPDILLMFWTTLIVLLPLGWFFATHPNEFLAPMNRVGILGSWMQNTVKDTGQSPLLILLNQFWMALEGYVELPLRAWYMPGVPLLRPLPGVLFLLGIVFTVLHLKDSRSQLLLIWLLGFVAAVGLSESDPAAQRYVAAAPAAALMIGYSMQQLGTVFGRFFPQRTRVITAVSLLVILLISADDARFYYVDYTRTSDFSGFNGMVAQTLANQLQNEPAGTQVVFCGYPQMNYNSIPSLPYLAPRTQYYNVVDAWGSADTPSPTGSRILFVFLPGHEMDQEGVANTYPGGTWQAQYSFKGELLYWLYTYNRF